jgi:hypothetical protein
VIPVEVWVDRQNLVRRVTLSLRLPGAPDLQGPAGQPSNPGRSSAGRLVLVTDFYDFGVPVRVSAPPAAQVASAPALSQGSLTQSGPPSPPAVSGTLTPAEASAAARAVAAFWRALGRHDAAAVARTVPPAQRSCVQPILTGGPTITVAAFRLVSVNPAGNGRATVRFTVRARASIGGHSVPVLPEGPGRVQWLEASQAGGRWYVDLSASSGFMFGGGCPSP